MDVFVKYINQHALNRFLKACEDKEYDIADSNYYRIVYNCKEVNEAYEKDYKWLGNPTIESSYKDWTLYHEHDLRYERFVSLGQLFEDIRNNKKYNIFLELRKKLTQDNYKEESIVISDDVCTFNKNEINKMVDLLKNKNIEEAFKLFKKIINSNSLKKNLTFNEMQNYNINSIKEPDINDSYKYWLDYFINYYYASYSYEEIYQFEDDVKSEILLDIFNRLKRKISV